MRRKPKRWPWLGAVLLLGAAAGGAWWEWGRPPAPFGVADEDLPLPPAPPRLGGARDYNDCLDMIESDPEGALQAARNLSGDAGLHCQGLAEVELGDPELGAPILMRVGMDAAEEPGSRAAILGQASRAFLMFDATKRARAATLAALKLVPDNPDLRFDDALAAEAEKDFSGAVADLDVTLAADPRNDDVLVARATSERELGRLDQAWRDADAAVALDGEDQDALLERGIIRQRLGDPAGARADWEAVEAIDPASPSAELAGQDLDLLEAAGS